MFVQRTIVQNVWNGPVSDRDVCLANLVKLAMESYKDVPPRSKNAARDVFMRCSKLFADKCVGTGRDRLFCVLVIMASDARLVDIRPYLDVCEATVAAEFNARVPLLQKYLCQKYVRWPTSHECTELRTFSTGTCLWQATGGVRSIKQ